MSNQPMRVAIYSQSIAVKQALRDLLLMLGYVCSDDGEAECYLIDTLHPISMPHIPEKAITLYLATEDTATPPHTIACPIRLATLTQRLALARSSQTLPLGHGWTVDTLSRHLHHSDQPTVTLTEKECRLLQLLLQASRPLPRDSLLAEAWGITQDVETHTLETHIYRLRSKLAELTPQAADIITEGGSYRLVSLA